MPPFLKGETLSGDKFRGNLDIVNYKARSVGLGVFQTMERVSRIERKVRTAEQLRLE